MTPWWQPLVLSVDPAKCPNLLDHTPAPTGYLEWHEWARLKSKTHKQIRCRGCGRFQIWIPRERRSKVAA